MAETGDRIDRARYGRRLPPPALRAIIVVVGVFAIVRLTGT
jgi:hypothetical protein